MERVLKRQDGTQYKIMVSLTITGYDSKSYSWKFQVFYRNKGKKNWLTIPYDLPEYRLRQLSLKEQRDYINNNYFNFVSKEEVIEVMNQYLETLKPNIEDL
jgi:hypothetical protein